MFSKWTIAGTGLCAVLIWTAIAVLAVVLPDDQFGTVMFGVVVAMILAGLSLGCFVHPYGRGSVVAVVCVTSGLAFGLNHSFFPILGSHAVVGAFGIALGLCLGVTFRSGKPRRMIAVLTCAGLLSFYILDLKGLAIASTVMGALVIMGLSLVLYTSGERRDLPDHDVQPSSAGLTLFRASDAVLAAILLPVNAATVYLVVWCFAATSTGLFAELSRVLRAHLAPVWKAGPRSTFTAHAARTNLGFLLIGGGGLLFIFVAARESVEHLPFDTTMAVPVLAWLILSHSGPALLGASDVFMRLTQMRSQQIWILILWGPVAIATLLILAPTDPVELAGLVALFHLGYSAHAALLVGLRHGIWPGVTAVLQKELKLT